MGNRHDPALRRLAENSGEFDVGNVIACDNVGQHVARPHGRQLVAVSHEQKRGVGLERA